MTRFPDVIPEFVTVDAPERDVLPALARLLIDLDRHGETRPDGQELLKDGPVIMLKSLDPLDLRLTSPCPSNN